MSSLGRRMMLPSGARRGSVRPILTVERLCQRADHVVVAIVCTEVENRPVRKNHCVSAEVAEILYPLYIGCTKL